MDFELELIHRDEVNVTYILKLLVKLRQAKAEDHEKHKQAILDLLAGEVKLRSKRELIAKFIEQNLPYIEDIEDITDEFERFWSEEQQGAFDDLCKEEGLIKDKFQLVLENYLFTERLPLRDDIVSVLVVKPKLLERKIIGDRVIQKITDFVETFINGMG